MPVLLTEAYANRQFYIPLATDKSEGVWVKPLTETRRRQIREASLQEAGHDSDLATTYAVRDALKACIAGWKGFVDADGKPIECTPEAIADCCRCDPDYMATLYMRICAVARFGEVCDLRD